MDMPRNEYNALVRNDFMSFVHRAFIELNPGSPLLHAPYIDLIVDRLEQCRHGKIRRLIINLPPRNLKSHCASISFVAWLLGHQPSAQVICASYGQDLADKLALDCRKVMTAPWYQELFDTRLSQERRKTDDFMTTQAGSRMSTSVGGVLTGRGADFIIIDDPLKPDDGLSESQRTAVNNWYDSTLLSRLNNKKSGCIILIMQRLHQDDLVGHVLGQDDWTVLNLPAIAETDEAHEMKSVFGTMTYRRLAGEALHPERESVAMLEKTRATIGDYNFSAQYQQTPIPVGGAIVKTHWLMTYDLQPERGEFTHILQSWDTAMKATDLSDYSVCTTWGYMQGRYHLLDVFRKRLTYPELKRAVIEQARKHSPHTILIEDKSSGSPLLQELIGQVSCSLVAYELPANKDKQMRLHAVSDLFEGGQVYLPQQVPWLADYRLELTSFPGSKYDDQVDSTTQALQYLSNKYDRNLGTWERLNGFDNLFTSFGVRYL
ncbi:phage terminase large subunit [Methylibium sp.]|uniref:phage terminase large subunit n=1 Tax=Methylibium sp. TaxID=2067992 RepID=UPI003BAA7034